MYLKKQAAEEQELRNRLVSRVVYIAVLSVGLMFIRYFIFWKNNVFGVALKQ